MPAQPPLLKMYRYRQIGQKKKDSTSRSTYNFKGNQSDPGRRGGGRRQSPR